MLSISSEKNPKIQQIIRLREKARERKKENLFVIEGVRELSLALKGGIAVREIFFCPEFMQPEALDGLKKKAENSGWTEISKNVYGKIAVRESTEGVIAVAEMRELPLEKIRLPGKPLILVAENVEKPGNLGALLRTADAAALDAVIVCDTGIDIYNPNVIRSSLGCLFTQQIAVCSSESAIMWLKKNHIKIFAATPEGAQIYFKADYNQPCAIVVGSEAEGLSSVWMENSDSKIAIPMQGEIDSLNVSVSAAVVLFEAVRQRNFTSSN